MTANEDNFDCHCGMPDAPGIVHIDLYANGRCFDRETYMPLDDYRRPATVTREVLDGGRTVAEHVTFPKNVAEWIRDDVAKAVRRNPQAYGKDRGEVRFTSETGGQKGDKPEQFDQISPEVEMLVAEHFGKGAAKYDRHNFRKGYPWRLCYNALRRHLAAFWAGEEYDVCPADHHGCKGDHTPDEHGETCENHTGSLHIVAVIWHAMVLTEFYLHHKEFDDRYRYES